LRHKLEERKKEKRLEEYEMMKKVQLDSSDKDSDEKKDDNFGVRLATKIADNLQLEIRNVHIRYEDATNPKVKQK